MRTLVAGVGYTNLRDMSVGPLLVERLAAEPWPAGVDVLDLGCGAVHAAHYLQDAQAAAPYERGVVFGAVRRGRAPGAVTRYRWDGRLPTPEEVQAHVAEAVTGVISLEGLLIVCRQLGALPEEIVVVEVEPADDSWGPECSPAVAAALPAAARVIRQAALESPGAQGNGPPRPLGGRRHRPVR
jgi:hydrogenase maturation protease